MVVLSSNQVGNGLRMSRTNTTRRRPSAVNDSKQSSPQERQKYKEQCNICHRLNFSVTSEYQNLMMGFVRLPRFKNPTTPPEFEDHMEVDAERDVNHQQIVKTRIHDATKGRQFPSPTVKSHMFDAQQLKKWGSDRGDEMDYVSNQSFHTTTAAID